MVVELLTGVCCDKNSTETEGTSSVKLHLLMFIFVGKWKVNISKGHLQRSIR